MTDPAIRQNPDDEYSHGSYRIRCRRYRLRNMFASAIALEIKNGSFASYHISKKKGKKTLPCSTRQNSPVALS